MAARITQEQIQQMVQLYEQLGTYSAVAKQMSVSAATVSRYVKQANTIVAAPRYTDVIEPPAIRFIDILTVKNFSELTPQEEESFVEWWKEFGR